MTFNSRSLYQVGDVAALRLGASADASAPEALASLGPFAASRLTCACVRRPRLRRVGAPPARARSGWDVVGGRGGRMEKECGRSEDRWDGAQPVG